MSERWERVRELFEIALALPPSEREALLDAECASEPELRRELAELLAADAVADGFLDEGAILSTCDSKPLADGGDGEQPAEPLRQVGAYRLVRKIGQGGMSTVYLAVRADDEFDRRVVVKLIRPEMESPQILDRLRVERQILANLDHPYITSLFDGGTTEDGRPYFVMEYVEGWAIDTYCTENQLTLRERLQLFRKVCEAVAVAHQNLVVHRDLKPSNIWITTDGSPRLLDFGIAKLLNPQTVGAAPEPTAAWLRLMTPHYASPEQVAGGPITTASDIYSLGVLLYLLLTGHLPHRFASRSISEVERILTHEAAPPASLVVRTRQSHDEQSEGLVRAPLDDPDRLSRMLRGDLDAILARTLRATPRHRYPSVQELSDEIERYLLGLPVVARRGGWRYRAGKFLRRRWPWVAVTTALILIMIGFSLALARQVSITEQERDAAQLERDRKGLVVALLRDIFQAGDPYRGGSDSLTVVEALDRLEPISGLRLAEQPATEAELLHTVGSIYTNLGHYARGERLLRRAVDLWRSSQGDPREEATMLGDLATAMAEQGHFEEAEATARSGVELVRPLAQTDPSAMAEALNQWTMILCSGERYDRAEEPARRALELAQKDPNSPEPLALALHQLGRIDHARGHYEAAARLYRQSLEVSRSFLGEDHLSLITTWNNLGSALRLSGDLAGAATAFEKILTLQRHALSEDHPDLARTLNNLAKVRSALGNHRAAIALLTEAAEILARNQENDPRRLIFIEIRLADTLLLAGEAGEAAHRLEAALPLWRQSLGEDNWRVAMAQGVLGSALAAVGRAKEAEALLIHSFEVLLDGSKESRRQTAYQRLAHFYEERDQSERAAPFAARLAAASRAEIR